MPKYSERKEALDQLKRAITLREIIGLQTRTLQTITNSPHISPPSILDDSLLVLIGFIKSERFLKERVSIPKQIVLRNMLFSFPDTEFKQIVRVEKRTFQYLLNLIKYNPIFVNESRNTQKYYEKFISADSFIRIVNSLTYVNQKALSSVDRYAISFLAVCM